MLSRRPGGAAALVKADPLCLKPSVRATSGVDEAKGATYSLA